MMKVSPKIGAVLALLAGVALLISYTGAGAQAQTAPRYKFEPRLAEAVAEQVEDGRRHGPGR